VLSCSKVGVAEADIMDNSPKSFTDIGIGFSPDKRLQAIDLNAPLDFDRAYNVETRESFQYSKSLGESYKIRLERPRGDYFIRSWTLSRSSIGSRDYYAKLNNGGYDLLIGGEYMQQRWWKIPPIKAYWKGNKASVDIKINQFNILGLGSGGDIAYVYNTVRLGLLTFNLYDHVPKFKRILPWKVNLIYSPHSKRLELWIQSVANKIPKFDKEIPDAEDIKQKKFPG